VIRSPPRRPIIAAPDKRSLADTKFRERPDYEAANHFLIIARREIAGLNPL
jgi:hypothetical protein